MARKRPGTKGAKINKANKTLNHALQNIGSMGRFVEFVAYKVERLGKRVIQIDEAYTTQICAKCGHQAKRGLSERIIVCGNCGHQADRDLLAALNILACFYLQKDRFGDLL
ncbi:MAG: zinc ribbon domain-containing protein, partial [Candidatus Hermodarchaeota archaeon]